MASDVQVVLEGLESVRPNVVIIACDQFRGDCLGFDGHPNVKMPYLDTQAVQGTYFESAYTVCPSCIPACASLLAGQCPEMHGRVGYQDDIPWNYERMMSEVFSAAGYQTAPVGTMYVHSPCLACGFQYLCLYDGYIGSCRKVNCPHWMHWDVSDGHLRLLHSELGPIADVNATGVKNNSWISRPWPYEERLRPTNWVADERKWSIATRDCTWPFLLMASFVRSYPPFGSSAYYLIYCLALDLRPPASGDWDDTAATVCPLTRSVVRLVYPRHNRRYMLLNAQICLNNAAESPQIIDETLSLKMTVEQRMALLVRALTFFIEQGEYDRAAELLIEIREKGEKSLAEECEYAYAIHVQRSSAYYIWQTEAELEHATGGERITPLLPALTPVREQGR